MTDVPEIPKDTMLEPTDNPDDQPHEGEITSTMITKAQPAPVMPSSKATTGDRIALEVRETSLYKRIKGAVSAAKATAKAAKTTIEWREVITMIVKMIYQEWQDRRAKK